LAGAAFAGAFFTGVFVAGVFCTGAAFAGVFFATAFVAAVFVTAVFVAGTTFADAFFATTFVAGAAFAGAAFTALFFATVVFATVVFATAFVIFIAAVWVTALAFAGCSFAALVFTGAAFAGVFFVIAGPTVAPPDRFVGASIATRASRDHATLYPRAMRRFLPCMLLLVTLLAACGPNDPELPKEPAYCTPPPMDFFDAGAPVDGATPRTLTIGAGEDAAFTPWAAGASVPVIMGFQGGAMITPTLRIPALPSDGATLCLRVELRNRLSDGSDVFPGVMTDFTFTRVGDVFEAANIFDQLGFSASDFAGKTLVLDADVIGVTFRANASLTLTLTN